MDQRLWSIYGLRLERLTTADLPNVARAIVGYTRGFATVKAGCIHNTSYVLFKAEGFQQIIRGDDWAKLLPYFLDNTFSPPAHLWRSWDNIDFSMIDTFDSQYYNSVLSVLQTVFTVSFPTSYL
jgi:hypothetical protein